MQYAQYYCYIILYYITGRSNIHSIASLQNRLLTVEYYAITNLHNLLQPTGALLAKQLFILLIPYWPTVPVNRSTT